MIGDSWNSDIQGAINAGIDQIWVKWNSGQSDPDKTATCEVSNLREIMELL
jgi:FMN phosphatase YigB (HAD superfamily)